MYAHRKKRYRADHHQYAAAQTCHKPQGSKSTKAAEQAESGTQIAPAAVEETESPIPDSDSQEPLERLLNFSDLDVLTNGNAVMRYELFTVTLTSNIDDLRMAEDLYELEDWPEMASCVHRISGAAQIIGAYRAESCCRELEKACL